MQSRRSTSQVRYSVYQADYLLLDGTWALSTTSTRMHL